MGKMMLIVVMLAAGCGGRAIDAPMMATTGVTDPACVWNFSTPAIAGEANAPSCFVPAISAARPALEVDLRIPDQSSIERIVFDLAAFRPLPSIGERLDAGSADEPLVHEILPNDPAGRPLLDCYSGHWIGSILVDGLPSALSPEWQVEIDASCAEDAANALHGVMSGHI